MTPPPAVSAGRRPCLVLTVDTINDIRRTVGVIPLSTSPRVAEPIVIAVKSIGPQTVAICDRLRAVDKRKFGRLVGGVDRQDLARVEESVKAVFGPT
jgi:mRNA interferase MazF